MRERLIQIGWRWFCPKAPPGHKYSEVFTDDKPGPSSHAIAAANNSTFGPVKVQKVYALEEEEE